MTGNASTPHDSKHLSPAASFNDEATLQPAVETPKDTKDKDTAGPVVSSQQPDNPHLLEGKRLAVVFCAMLLCLLLVALDQTILATALPKIASDFHHFQLQGWVSSAFVLTQAAFLLIHGQVLRIYPAKWCLLASIFVFELGSLICGVSPNVYVLIFGRALSGAGAAGIFIAMLQILGQAVKLEKRPKLFGAFGAVFGLSSIIGPLIGGALTDHATWRWCFYINLPVGGVASAAVLVLLKAAPPLGSDPSKRSVRDLLQQTLRLDWAGSVLILGAVTTLVMALQWGGNTRPWNNAGVIVCFVVSGVLFPAYILLQKWLGPERAMLPLSIFRSVSIYAICLMGFFSRWVMFIYVYYVPLYYQAARGRSATDSGVDIIALMLATVVAVIGAGRIVGVWGYYWPFLITGPVFQAIGGGLLYTIHQDTPNAKVIGYQIITGFGVGLTLQNSIFAMQAEFDSQPKLVAQATGMASFSMFLGGAITLSVGQTVFASVLKQKLAQYAPGVDSAVALSAPSDIRSHYSGEEATQVITAYVKTLDIVFLLGVAGAGAALISAVFVKNLRIKPKKAPKADKAEKGEESKEDKAVSPAPSKAETEGQQEA